MFRFGIVIFSSIVVAYISVGQIWMLNLEQIDWFLCFENAIDSFSGTETELRHRVSEMNFNQRWLAFQNEPLSNKILPLFFVALPFLPIILAMTLFKNMKQVWVLLFLLLFFTFLFWPDLGRDAARGHDCDRKGADGILAIVFVMPIVFLITLITVGILALIDRKKGANL